MATKSTAPLADKRMWMYIVAAIAVIVIVAAAYMAMQQDTGPDEADLASLDSSSTAQPGEETSGGAQFDSEERDPAMPGQAPSGAQPGTQPANRPGSDDAAPQPRPVEPPADGTQLTTITTPPDATVAMLNVPDDFEEATFRVAFRPYGPAMAGPTGPGMVIHVTDMKPLDGQTDDVRDLTGRNAVCGAPPSILDSIELGGTYIGILEVRAMGDVGALTLREVKAAE